MTWNRLSHLAHRNTFAHIAHLGPHAPLAPLTPIARVSVPTSTSALQPLAQRHMHTTGPVMTTVGYGDPGSEKAENHTPTPKPSSSSDPQPEGHGKKAGQQNGSTDPEVKPFVSGSQGSKSQKGKDGSTKTAPGDASSSEIRETKTIGSEPKHEEVGGAGPVGG